MPEPSISADAFRDPFDKQVAFFRQKLGNQVPTERWTDLQKEQHDKAFMVAGATKAQLLSDLAVAVDKSIAQGQSIEQFRKDFKHTVEKHGWNYRGDFNWRTRVIYTTNLRTSYAAGRLEQLQEFSYWTYKHSGAENFRPQHKAWNNLTRPQSDSFWKTHYPPNGWGCGCRVVGTRSAEDAEKYLDGELRPAPDDGINPRTGTPYGIDKGWDYMPGSTVLDTIKALTKQTVVWRYELSKAYMQSLPEHIKDPFSRSYRDMPSTADAARQYAKRVIEPRPNYQEYQTFGLVESRDVEQIKGMVFKDDREPVKEYKDLDVSGFDFTINESSVGHIQRQHGPPGVNAKGKRVGEWQKEQRPVTPEDYELIPKILNDPDVVKAGTLTDRQRLPAVTYTKTINGEKYILTLEILAGKRSINVHSLAIKRKKAQVAGGGT